MLFTNFNLRDFYELARIKYPLLANIIRRVHFGLIINNTKKRISGKGNEINYKYSILSAVKININGNNNIIDIEPECIIKGLSIIIIGDNHRIKIGRECKINRGGLFRLVDADGELKVGNKTTIESAHIAITEQGSKIEIGDDCMLAYDIDIRTGDSHAIFDSKTNERINYAKDVLIRDHVWIAAHCFILKGVLIPSNSIVATGSVVTKTFSQEGEGIILAGNPAKIVKTGIIWMRDR